MSYIDKYSTLDNPVSQLPETPETHPGKFKSFIDNYSNDEQQISLPQEEEGILKSTGRYAMQAAKALPLAIRGVPQALFAGSLLTGGTLNEGEEEILNRGKDKEGRKISFDEATGEWSDNRDDNFVPESKPPSEQMGRPLGDLYDFIEEKTGLPLAAKTPGQKLLSVGSDTASLASGNAPYKAITGIASGILYEALLSLGLSENAASNIAMAAAHTIGNKGIENAGRKSKATEPQNLTAPRQIETKALVPEYEQGKNILSNIQQQSKQSGPISVHDRIPSIPVIPKMSSTGRDVQVTQGNDLGQMEQKTETVGNRELSEQTGPNTRLREIKRSVEPEERLGEAVTKFRMDSPHEIASTSQKILRQRSDEEHEIVNKNYNISRKKNSQIMGDRPDLLETSINRRTELERQGARKLDAQIMDILDEQIEFLQRGAVSNQDLIDRERNIRKYTQHKYAHDPKNVFLPIAQDIEKEILRSAKGNPEAYQSYRTAQDSNRVWQEKYNNKYIRPFLDKTNKDYNNLFNSLMDEDTYNVLSPILEEAGTHGSRHAQSIKRGIIERSLRPFVKKDGALNTNLINDPSFRRQINEMSILTPENRQSILSEARSWKKGMGGRTVTPVNRSIDWWNGLAPEQAAKETKNISGLEKIKKSLGNTEKGKELFENIKQDAGIYRLRGGKTENEKSIKSIANVLEDIDNVHYLEYTFGKEKVSEWQDIIKEHKTYDARIKEIEKAEEKASSEETKKKLRKERVKLVAKKEIAHALLDVATPLPGYLKRLLVSAVIG